MGRAWTLGFGIYDGCKNEIGHDWTYGDANFPKEIEQLVPSVVVS
jgi:hypothetical protein